MAGCMYFLLIRQNYTGMEAASELVVFRVIQAFMVWGFEHWEIQVSWLCTKNTENFV